MKMKTRQRDESLTELALAMRKLAHHTLRAPDPCETIARHYVIDLLSDADIDWKIHQSPCKTLR